MTSADVDPAGAVEREPLPGAASGRRRPRPRRTAIVGRVPPPRTSIPRGTNRCSGQLVRSAVPVDSPGDRRCRRRRRLRARLARGALAALKHRDFALFFSAAFCSNTGTWMQTITVPYVLDQLTHSTVVGGRRRVRHASSRPRSWARWRVAGRPSRPPDDPADLAGRPDGVGARAVGHLGHGAWRRRLMIVARGRGRRDRRRHHHRRLAGLRAPTRTTRSDDQRGAAQRDAVHRRPRVRTRAGRSRARRVRTRHRVPRQRRVVPARDRRVAVDRGAPDRHPRGTGPRASRSSGTRCVTSASARCSSSRCSVRCSRRCSACR